MGNPPLDGLEALRSWNHCHGAFYQASESDLRWNQKKQSLVTYSGADVAGVPVVVASATPEGAAMGILEKGLWVSLFGDVAKGNEAEFAEALEAFAKARGKTRVAMGSDEFHFLPGIPVDEPAGKALAEALRARGFSSADCVDFVGDPRNSACAAYVKSAQEDAAKRGWALRLVSDDQGRAELTEFLSKEFPGRWFREWKIWQARPDTARAFWNLLYDEKQKVLGFSRLAVRGRLPNAQEGWVPGAMRLPLTSAGGWANTDSCLGPIGISAAERGRGAGKILLGLSIHELCLQGAEHTCIDWTNAYNYYTPLGFQIARRYQTVWKEL